MGKDPLVLTVTEAAELLGISRSLAYEAARSGELPGVIRIGRRVVVSRSKLLEALGVPA
jgi:excisionase family DNA binding protein